MVHAYNIFLFQQIWNWDLAKVASDYADKCLFAHNPKRSIEYGATIGENIYYISVDITERDDLASVVDAWDAEKEYYDYKTLVCSKAPCGHYTQVRGHEHIIRLNFALQSGAYT